MKIEHFTDVPAETVEGVPGVTVRWVISEKHGASRARCWWCAPGF
jgi:hypothetical protein